MALILIAGLGIALGQWVMARRALEMSPITFTTSAVNVIHLPGTSSRFWIKYRQLTGRWRTAVGSAFLMSVVAFGVFAIKFQTVAPTKSSVDAEFYLKRGEDFSGVHQYDRAIADYAAAIELKPDYAEAYNDRGFAYYLKGDFEQAIADYTRAIELRPNYPKAYNSRGVVYMSGGYGEAKSVPDFDRAIELKPDFRYAYINRASARLFSHPRLALQDFHRAGMHPERTVGILGSVLLMLALAVTFLILKRRRIRGR